MINLSIFLGLATLIIFFLLSKRNLRKTIFLLAFLLPLDNRIYFSWGFSKGSPVRWALIGIVLFLLYQFLARYKSKSLKIAFLFVLDSLKSDIFFLLLVAVWVVRLVSFLVSENLTSSISYQIFFTEIFLIYLIIRRCFKEGAEDFIIKFLKYYVIAGFLVSLISPYQYYLYKFQNKVVPGVWPLEGRPVRIGSLFWDINHFGAYLSTVIPFVLYLFLKAKEFKIRIFYLVILSFTLLAFGMTLSRSAFIGLAAGLSLFIILLSLKGYIKQAAFVFLSIFFIVAVPIAVGELSGQRILYQLQKRFLSIKFSYRVWDDSINAHSALAYGSWQILESNPIIGGGYGSFNEQFRKTEVSKKYFNLDPVRDVVIPPHSLWFEPLSATGFVGSVPFFIFLYFIFYLLFKRYKNSRKPLEVVLSTSFLSALTAVYLSGVFYSYNLEFFYIFLFLALFYGYRVRKLPLDRLDICVLTFLTTLAGAFVFYKLDAITLIDWDESIYAGIAKNIVKDIGDYFGLVWQRDKGYWFEKPPLYIWLTSFAYLLFGINEFSARFFSALSGVLGVLVLYFFGKRLFGRKVGILSAIVLATSVHWIFQSRNGTLDVLSAFWILLSMYSFWSARNRNKEWGWVGVFLGLTLMTKSAVVLIPVSAIILFILLDVFIFKNKRKYSIKSSLISLLTFVAVGFPWHLVEYIRFGREFVDSYLFYHILRRAKGIEGHSKDFWWYIIVIKVWFRHWFVILIPAILLSAYKLFSRFVSKEDKEKFSFLLIWIFTTFFIFSFSVSKIQWYIIPIYPALALITGWFLANLFEYLRKIFKWRYMFVFYVFAISVFSSYLVVYWKDMWILDDYNRGLKNIGEMIAEQRDRYYFIPRKVPVYIYNLPPGPPLFYIQRYAKIVGKSQIGDMFKSPPGKAFMAVTRKESYEKLQKEYKNPRVIIYAQSKDFVLFGKDWKDVRDQFNQQPYHVPKEIYDPFFFEENI